jgi:hypothetical protein
LHHENQNRQNNQTRRDSTHATQHQIHPCTAGFLGVFKEALDYAVAVAKQF